MVDNFYPMDKVNEVYPIVKLSLLKRNKIRNSVWIDVEKNNWKKKKRNHVIICTIQRQVLAWFHYIDRVWINPHQLQKKKVWGQSLDTTQCFSYLSETAPFIENEGKKIAECDEWIDTKAEGHVSDDNQKVTSADVCGTIYLATETHFSRWTS